MAVQPGLVLIISDIKRWAQFEWIADGLRARGYAPKIIILNPEPAYFESFLKENSYQFRAVQCAGYLSYMSAFLTIFRQLKQWDTKLVHCHFVKAGLIGLSAAWVAGVKNRVYTRHHSDFHHKYQPKGVFLDRICNFLSTKIIAITAMVKGVLVKLEGVKESKIKVVHHGFELDGFINPAVERIQSLRQKYNLAESQQVMGVVSRFIKWKGVDYIIEAFKALQEKHPDLILVLANARGPEKDAIIKSLEGIPGDKVRIIEFEQDLFSIFHLFSVFVHCPVDETCEAFGQVYVEAAASGCPMVITHSGIATEVFEDQSNALVVPYRDSVAIAESVDRLLSDRELAQRLGARASESVSKEFTMDRMLDQLEEVYLF